ncbi:hypothetical protein HJB82_11640 [Rhizobium sp. NZLR10]|nr:hypothetical protein [Rhizobium sp. NZLR10]
MSDAVFKPILYLLHGCPLLGDSPDLRISYEGFFESSPILSGNSEQLDTNNTP